MTKLVFVLGLLLMAVPVRATDFYIAQNSSRTSGGSSCGNALSLAWINNRSSWGNGSAQVGPGDTVHLCGTFNGAAGQQLLIVRGSGQSGHPITIKFEPGANLSAPYWSGQGAIYMSGVSYITVDGGSSGVIQNTENGTGKKYHQNSMGIYAPGCTSCTVQNLTVANLYVRNSATDTSASHSMHCVYWLDSNNFTVNNVTCHDTSWAIAGFGNNFTLEHSNIYNVDHGLAVGPTGAMSGISVHDNHIHDYAKWDSPNNAYHHDGIHLWGQHGGSITNGAIYNNLFDGDPGVNITADVYLQDSIRGMSVYNNVFTAPTTRTINALWFAAGSTSLNSSGNSAYHNTIVAGGHRAGSAMYVESQIGFTAANNIFIGGLSDISIQGGGNLSSSGINNNVYLDLLADYGDSNTFGYQHENYHALSDWQHACRCDGSSSLVTSTRINLGSLGQLLVGSVGVKAGLNLTHIATGELAKLTTDKAGTLRPGAGAWDVGAYQAGSAVKASSPSGVTVTVQ